MPTRTTRKAKVGREDHLHPLTRRIFFCNYFFNKGGCNKGDKCLYSHSQKVYDAKMKDKKRRSGSRDSSRGKKE